jgi:hypothetical protein
MKEGEKEKEVVTEKEAKCQVKMTVRATTKMMAAVDAVDAAGGLRSALRVLREAFGYGQKSWGNLKGKVAAPSILDLVLASGARIGVSSTPHWSRRKAGWRRSLRIT